jgi:CheY-like chemotaxis protein
MLESPSDAVLDSTGKAGGGASQDLSGLQILLAEDGIDNQRLIAHVLRSAGADVQAADNGKIAVERASAGHFDVILMDMQMPEMDGYQATSYLREQGFTRPILALTAHAMASDRQSKLIRMIASYAGKETSLDQTPTDSAQKPSTPTSPLIESEFADDPDFVEIIDQFVASLAEKLHSMKESLANGDFETLQRFAHQLKGAGGSYGYPGLTDAAKLLEDAAKAQDPEAAGLAFAPLPKLSQAIIAGRTAATIFPGGSARTTD